MVVLQSALKRQNSADNRTSGPKLSNSVEKHMLDAKIEVRSRLSRPQTTATRWRSALPSFNAEELAWASLAFKALKKGLKVAIDMETQ